jgi:hypothetical protein
LDPEAEASKLQQIAYIVEVFPGLEIDFSEFINQYMQGFTTTNVGIILKL